MGSDFGIQRVTHLHAVTDAGGDTYQYDANGNQTTRVINGETTLFVGAHYELTDSSITRYY